MTEALGIKSTQTLKNVAFSVKTIFLVLTLLTLFLFKFKFSVNYILTNYFNFKLKQRAIFNTSVRASYFGIDVHSINLIDVKKLNSYKI